MGCDPFSPISEAQINVLCVPAFSFPNDHFEQCVKALQACSLVSLQRFQGVIAADAVSNNFDLSRGSVLLNVSSDYDSDSSPNLYPFAINRRPQIVLGIASGDDILSTAESEHQDKLQSIVTNFARHTASYDNLWTSHVIAFGGPSPKADSACLWVDTEGQGPNVPDVLLSVVVKLHERLLGIVQRLESHRYVPVQLSGTSHRRSTSPDASASDQVQAVAGSTSDRTERPSQSDAQHPPLSNQDGPDAARHSIILGIFCLQAGRWSDAFNRLSEGTTGARSLDDHVWHAKGLEGLLVCMLLSAWAHLEFSIPQICYSNNEKNNILNLPRSMAALISANRMSSVSLFSGTSISATHNLTELLPQLIARILGLYERISTSFEGTIGLVLLCESRIRWASLLIAIKNHGDTLQDQALQYIVEGNHTNVGPRTSASPIPTLVLPTGEVSKLLIESALDAQVKLPAQEATPLCVAVIKGMSLLNLQRKLGFHLKSFLQKLGPALIEARRLGAAEVGVHPATSLPPLSVRRNGQSNSLDGLRSLLNVIANTYGLPVPRNKMTPTESNPKDRLNEALKLWMTINASGDLFIKLDILSMCIEISDAMPDPSASLYFTSILLQAAKQSMTISSKLINTPALLSTADQSRLIQNIKRAADAADRLGYTALYAEYWDRFLVRDIYLLEDSHTNRLMPHTAQDLSVAVGTGEAKKDPFIFNPFAKAKATNSIAVVTRGEAALFGVVLQNPLDIDIEIENITLVATGVDFTPSDHSIVLGPLCTQVFTLAGIPEQIGEVKITGCKARIRGCYEETFLILPDQWKFVQDTKQNMRHGASSPVHSIPTPRSVEISVRVIEPLPSLNVSSSSLLQPSIMLLEGESTKFDLVVFNESAIDVDLVLVTFEDSVKKRLEEALTNKNLSPADMYEIQHQIASRPAIGWKNEKADLRIDRKTAATFVLEVFGKPGLTDITVFIDYTNLGRPKSEITEAFHTRQLSYSLTTTINGSIDIPRCLVLPVQSDLDRIYSDDSSFDTDKRLFPELSATGTSEKCILLLDVRNIWPQPLEVEFRALRSPTADMEGEANREDTYKVSEVLQPGQMSRMLILVPRILILYPHAVIPSLDTKRQFVVSATMTTIEAEIASREAFWYRERLLSCLSATWKEQYGQREGQLDMRKSIRLNSRMIDALRVDHVEISFMLQSAHLKDEDAISEQNVVQKGSSTFSLIRNTFATLTTTVCNHSSEDLKLLLRLQPSLRSQPHNIALDLSKRFAWSGSLQQALYPILRAGESRTTELGIVALAVGDFEINGTVEEIRRDDSQSLIERSITGAGVGARRIWHARRPCMIDSVDIE